LARIRAFLKPLFSAAVAWLVFPGMGTSQTPEKVDFEKSIKPIFQKHCVSCHGATKPKGGLDLTQASRAMPGGNSGLLLVPHDPTKSLLYRAVAGLEPGLEMPPKGPSLTRSELDTLSQWIRQGAPWPGFTDQNRTDSRSGWAFQPLRLPSPPQTKSQATHPIDAFLARDLSAQGLDFAPETDRRTLLRRLTYDLTGLPPTPKEIEAFLNDQRPGAYERQVERLLGSVAHAERWARHWLDLAHYGDTHGFDKDQPRPHAWPYRDYLIRSFHADKPYSRFAMEQIAGDALFPGTRDGIEALGFLSAGPWDLIGHAEVPETKLDGKVARHLDRDDMVSTAIISFLSLTVHCAQCHNHKFDPITQEDYYGLQAVFAAVDRAEKSYYRDPSLQKKAAELAQKRGEIAALLAQLDRDIDKAHPPGIEGLRAKLASLALQAPGKHPAFGFHTALHATPAGPGPGGEWIELDLPTVVPVEKIVLWPCHDEFGGIGAGFGFPKRMRVDLLPSGNLPGAPKVTVLDRSAHDLEPPGFEPLLIPCGSTAAKTIRLEIPVLADRKGEYMAAFAELEVIGIDGVNHARGVLPRTSSTIEAPPRWSRANLTDGTKYEAPGSLKADYREARLDLEKALKSRYQGPNGEKRKALASELELLDRSISALPAPDKVYIATVHKGSGAFRGTGNEGGKPRPIFLLQRGNVSKPLNEVGPGAIAALNHAPARFPETIQGPESSRRAALARWIAHRDNPLFWRSAVNRVWRHHMGRGLVDTPSDFGKMGGQPSHPDLLDWLASRLRETDSLREIHRLIVTSKAYKQSSQGAPKSLEADPGNLLYSRFRRRRMDAESYRDSLLQIAGKLDTRPFGPPYRDFVVEKPEHSPHYLYEKSDPDDPATHRRSLYRFVVRSQQHPFLTTLDTADPSVLTDRRNETLGPLQALAMWNNRLVLTMAGHLAGKVRKEAGNDPIAQAKAIFRGVLLRDPEDAELGPWTAHIRSQGLESACRVAFNLSEFVFIE